MRACLAALAAGLSVLHAAGAISVGRSRRSSARAGRRHAPGEEDKVFMGGVPVYGLDEAMEHARKTHQYAKGNSGTLEEVAPWIVTFKDDVSAERLRELCIGGIFKGCSNHADRAGTPGRPGLPFIVCRCTTAQLNVSLAQTGEEAKLAAYDTPVIIGDAHLDFSQHLAGRRAATWGLNRINKDAAPGAGRAVHVYVLDTGVRCTHSQFGGRAIPTIESLGIVHKCSCQNTSCANDTHGHGTHCAGTAAGADYGVAPEARVHSVKVLEDDGTGYTSWSVAAESWILSHGMKPAVVSMSIGGSGNNQAERLAIDALVSEGIPVVVAAGNEGKDACDFNPAWIPSAITVGSTTSTDNASWFSNYGSCVDIFAPGSSILSAGQSSDTQTAWKSGTSMACPHVSGAAAILFSLNPSLTPEQIIAELLDKAENDAIADIAGLPDPTVNKLLQVDTLSGNASLIQGARWELIFRQTPGSFRPVSAWLLVNQDTADKSSGDYSVLQQLEDFRRADGFFDLKLVWPGSAHDDQVWRQSTNPVTKGSGGVDGYSAVSAPHTAQYWRGLEYNGNYCLLDGSVGHSRWFYAVGSGQPFSSGIPGPDGAAVDSVELYAWVEDTAPQTWISENGIEVSGTDAAAAQFPNASMGGAYIKHGPAPAGVALRTSAPASATSSEYVFYCLNDGYVKVLVVRVSSSGGKLYASAKNAKYQKCPLGTTPGATLANTVADSGATMQIVKRNFAEGYGVFFVKAS